MSSKRGLMAVTALDEEIARLANVADHRTLVAWAADCSERALPHFESKRPDDDRPRNAIRAAREYVRTGELRMTAVRRASLGSHAAARDVEDDDAARSAARSAGQAVAAAHVPAHAIAAAVYAATAVRDSSPQSISEEETLRERRWQLEHLTGMLRSNQ